MKGCRYITSSWRCIELCQNFLGKIVRNVLFFWMNNSVNLRYRSRLIQWQLSVQCVYNAIFSLRFVKFTLNTCFPGFKHHIIWNNNNKGEAVVSWLASLHSLKVQNTDGIDILNVWHDCDGYWIQERSNTIIRGSVFDTVW